VKNTIMRRNKGVKVKEGNKNDDSGEKREPERASAPQAPYLSMGIAVTKKHRKMLSTKILIGKRNF
jgi:hypothetical protein